MAKHALKPEHSTHNKMKLIIPIVVAGAILSSTAVVAQADTGQNAFQAVSTVTPEADVTPQTDSALSQAAVVTEGVISVPTTVKINFERTVVKSTPAPKPVEPPAPVVAPEASQPAAAIATTPAAVAAAAVAAAAVSPTNPANIPAAPAVKGVAGASDSFGAKIAAAAMAQVGVEQDCTMLVTNSLKAIGVAFHGWPADYMSLGQITTTPVPGDLIYYKNGGTGVPHIAIYLGGNKAVHGGWNGHTTAVGPANLGSGPIYIHVTR